MIMKNKNKTILKTIFLSKLMNAKQDRLRTMKRKMILSIATLWMNENYN